MPIMPRYPIYIPSKGRADVCLTACYLRQHQVPFFLVIEAQEQDLYAAQFGADGLLVLPFSNRGSVIPARNWIKAHATAAGAARHWQLDDNIRSLMRRWHDKRIKCHPGVALATVEDFADRYENVAIAGLNYKMFLPSTRSVPQPFYLNVHVYSCCLILNSLPYHWRGRYNEDTDYCLQALVHGWCTILVNCFCVDKMATMRVKGGNTTELYQGDGRLKMARTLERRWPGVVETKRRFRRPQHVIKNQWRFFDTPLQRKPNVDFATLLPVDEYGLHLVQSRAITSPELRDFLARTAIPLHQPGAASAASAAIEK
jgi:hypothetical protein